MHPYLVPVRLLGLVVSILDVEGLICDLGPCVFSSCKFVRLRGVAFLVSKPWISLIWAQYFH